MNRLVTEPKKVGVAAEAGAFLGAYQLGYFQVFEEFGIPTDVGVGTSVSAPNLAVFIATGRKTELMRETWCGFERPSDVFEPISQSRIAHTILSELLQKNKYLRHIQKIARPAQSIYKMDPLINIVSKIDPQALVNRPEEFITAAVCRATRKIQYFSTKDPEIVSGCLGEDKEALRAAYIAGNLNPMACHRYAKINLAILASCAIPGFLPHVWIHHRNSWQEYYDPGHERPLSILKAMDRGCDTIIVLRCHSNYIIDQMPNGILPKLIATPTHGSDRHAKEEIKKGRERAKKENLNFFVVEPKKRSRTHSSFTFRPSDFLQAEAHGREVILEELEPLIDYYSHHPRYPTSCVSTST
jgi:predicted acylesterase/phospholipase RssA